MSQYVRELNHYDGIKKNTQLIDNYFDKYPYEILSDLKLSD